MTEEPLLDIRGLRVGFGSPAHRLTVLDGLDLNLRKRGILALVGESGSGKSMTALAAMRLLPQGAAVTAGPSFSTGSTPSGGSVFRPPPR